MLHLPADLQAHAEQQWLRLQARLEPPVQAAFASHQAELTCLFGLSDFIADSCLQYPLMVLELLQSGELYQARRHADYGPRLAAALAGIEDDEAFKCALRRFRRRHMLVIAWRELLGRAQVEESFSHLTALAETLICGARDWLYAKLCRELGTPCNVEGEPQPLLILGMGKLGGGELNFSSDIDLIFTFPEGGQTQGGRRSLENQAFFIRLGQQLIQALHQTTVDGQVFRVDMRLRPFGDAGPLAISFAAMEDYYQNHGRNWERYAMVKARILGPESQHAQELQRLLRPFIFRRYIDFGAIDALRKMKGLIEAEVRRKGLKDNIKLGAGGIREVEFIAQAYQLIRGGREPALQVRHLPAALQALAELGAMPGPSIQGLLEAYRFLRRVENLLQEIADAQTQTLPEGERDRLRLITALGFADWASCYAQLERVMALVHKEFRQVIGQTEEQDDTGASVFWHDLWHGSQETDELARELLATVGEHCQDLAGPLWRFRQESRRRAIGPQGREALARLMPDLLAAVASRPQPGLLFERVEKLLTQILTRSAYLQLLAENPGALNQLLELCAASGVVAEQLARYPILLDELLDPQQLYHPTPLERYRDELRQYLLRVPEEDLEQQMEALRQFKQIQLLKISAADIAGALPLMKVSDHLTWLAEAILEEVVSQAWSQVTARHGLPPQSRETGEKGFCVVAYGKLGGIELGYGSDLDLVFLHGGEPTGETDGDRPIDVRQFYVRLAQRILHLFSTRTASGILYDTDMRLRPAGEAGLLVSNLAAYQRYQEQEAWTWEHQALVRSRAVYGEPAMRLAFEQVRRAVLSLPRDQAQLAADVLVMREKMRRHLLRGAEGEFDLKQGAGGMVDIEFITQYLVLAHAQAAPEALTRWSDNVRILEECVLAGLLSQQEGQALKQAYLAIRDEAHRCTLSGRSRIVPDRLLASERAQVSALWQRLFAGVDTGLARLPA